MNRYINIKFILIQFILALIFINISFSQTISGCTDYKASNYNWRATNDDGSCEYQKNQFYKPVKKDISGCTNISATNYNSQATIDDGSCIFQESQYSAPQDNSSFQSTSGISIKKIKSIIFNSPDGVKDIQIKIYDKDNNMIGDLLTDNYGSAYFTLDIESAINLELTHPDLNVKSNKGSFLNYEDIGNREEILLDLFYKKEIIFKINVQDLYTFEKINNAKFDIDNLKIVSDFIDNGQYEIKIPSSEVNRKNIKKGQVLDLKISTSKNNPISTIPLTVDLSRSNNYDAAVSREIIKEIKFIDFYTKKPLKNIEVIFNSSESMKTNSYGMIEFPFFGEKIGEAIKVDVKIPGYVDFTNYFELNVNKDEVIFEVKPIYAIFSAIDSKTNTPIENLQFYINKKYVSMEIEQGKYKVDFDEFNSEYNIFIKDSKDKYESKEISIVSNFKTIDNINKISIHQKTSIEFNIISSANNPVENAAIVFDSKEIGRTNKKGKFILPLKYSEKEKESNVSKIGYISSSKKFILEPGYNSVDIVLDPIACKINAYDFISNNKIDNLIIESDNILSYTYDSYEKLYNIYFKDFGSYKIDVYDEKNIYQDGSLNINISKSNNLKTYKYPVYEITYVNFEIIDENSNAIEKVKIKYNDKKIGSSKSSGKLRKRVYYESNNFNCFLKRNNYFPMDTTLKIIPGENNNYVLKLKKLPPIVIKAINKENGNQIFDISIKINDEIININDYTNIDPDSLNQEFSVSYSDGEIDFYDNNININYEGEKSQYDLVLNPVPYLYVNAFLESTSDPIAYLNLFINDEFVGKTSSRGFSKIKVEYNKNYNVIGKKEKYENVSSVHEIKKSKTDIDYYLKELNQSIFVTDVFDNPIPDVRVLFYDEEKISDEKGFININHNYLDEELELKFKSSSSIHKDTTKIYLFTDNNTTSTQVLRTNPLLLKIDVKDDGGNRFDGTIEINPSPNNKTSFELFNGLSNDIKVFKSNTYNIKVNIIMDNTPIEIEKNKMIYLEDKEDSWTYIVENPFISVKTNEYYNDDGEKQFYSVNISYLDDKKNILEYDLVGDGVQSQQLEKYGKYKLSYKPKGFKKTISRIIVINKPFNEFDLKLNESYLKCVNAYNSGYDDKAISLCSEVPIDDENYCKACLLNAKINSEQGAYYESSLYWEKINDGIKNNLCESNFSYYEIYADVISKSSYKQIAAANNDDDIATISVLENLWQSGGKLDFNFNKFSKLCHYQNTPEECEDNETSLKLNILQGISRIMETLYYKNSREINAERSNAFKSISELLYKRVEKYSDDVPFEDKSSFINVIEKHRIGN